jgi:WD40 repeat protein
MLPSLLRVWDLESGELRTVDTHVPGEEGCWAERYRGYAGGQFLSDGGLLTIGDQGVRIWDLERGGSRRIQPCREAIEAGLSLDRDRRRAAIVYPDSERGSTFGVLDLETEVFREVTSHGNRVSVAALDPTGTIVVTGDYDGVLRVGPVTGESPHLLYGHTLEVSSVAVSPDGKWIASGSQDGTIRLWPMPEGKPFHTLPYEKILARLRGLTNLRAVPDEGAGTGYRVSIGPFPGWKELPEW